MHGQKTIELYTSSTGAVSLQVLSDGDTVWLNRQQMAALFGRDVKTVGKHIASARREELDGLAVVAKFATTAADGKSYRVEHYNLDMVLSVGYRVKSREGVYFRRWANDVLRRYLVEGVATNERRLAQVGALVRVLSRSSDELVAGIADVLTGYVPSLRVLRDYDEGSIRPPAGRESLWRLRYDEARGVIDTIRAEFPDDALFGSERGDALKGVVDTLYQGFAGQELYPSVEEKAANLLYLVVKDHPLSDGNKRSAAALFVHFLARNDVLYDSAGAAIVSNNALAAITLMVAMSDPQEKDLMIALIRSLLTPESSGS